MNESGRFSIATRFPEKYFRTFGGGIILDNLPASGRDKGTEETESGVYVSRPISTAGNRLYG